MTSTARPALTVFPARAGDHNDRAMRAAITIGTHLSRRLETPATQVGTPEPALNAGWESELAAARPALEELSAAYEQVFAQEQRPVAALSRCTGALATVPVVARHRPDACVAWFDAHPDLNTPRNTMTGYLGGLALAGAAGLWDSGLGGDLALDNIVLAGARDLDPPERELVDSTALQLVSPQARFAPELRAAVAGRPVYVHLDCDVLEPGIVPTDYHVPNGLSLEDLHTACSMLAGHELAGLEISEFEESWTNRGEHVSPGDLLDALQPLLDALTD